MSFRVNSFNKILLNIIHTTFCNLFGFSVSFVSLDLLADEGRSNGCEMEKKERERERRRKRGRERANRRQTEKQNEVDGIERE